MIIAAVCPPDLDNGNDGLIFIERISRMKEGQRISRKRGFSDVYWIDSELKASTEGWRQFFVPDTHMTVDDLADTLLQKKIIHSIPPPSISMLQSFALK